MAVDNRALEAFARIEKHLDKIDDRLGGQDDKLGRQEVSLARLVVAVEDHVQRSNKQDENLELLRGDVKPIQRHVAMVEGGLKLIGVLSLLAIIVEAVLHIFGK
jgi:hypothetical protein